MLATIVEVPELEDTFIEIEILVTDTAEISHALDAVRAVLADLGVSDEALTTELYTDTVAAAQTSARVGNTSA
jgi:adenylate cyclase class 2